MKLNAEQIKKALEFCTSPDKDANCPFDCPYGDGPCEQLLMAHALALIKELTNDAVEWKALAEDYKNRFVDCRKENERLRAYSKELFEENNEYEKQIDEGVETCALVCHPKYEAKIDQAKADTVRKMQERLRERAYVPKPYGLTKVVELAEIDQLAKEMLKRETGNDVDTSVT